MKNSSLELVTQAPSAIAANSVSSLPQQRLDPSRGGQMITPILSRKGTSKSGAFPNNESIPSRTERACSPRNASSICDRRELSLFTASAAAGPEPRGADDRPNSLKKKGRARAELSPSAIAANSVSSLPQQRLDLSRGGQMIAPILSRKGTSKCIAFPKEKAHNERTPFPREQSARALRPTHKSCVSSGVRNTDTDQHTS